MMRETLRRRHIREKNGLRFERAALGFQDLVF